MAENSAHSPNRLTRQMTDKFCGRQAELAVLMSALEPEGHLVTYLYGIPGLGKSTLLNQFSQQATNQGAACTIMDCRLVEPTPRGFLAEWASLVGSDFDDPSTAAQAVGANITPTILCLDNYETFLLLDTWLRQTLMPLMPDSFRLVMSSRRPPVPLWTTASGWHGLFRAVALPQLEPAAARELLQDAKVTDALCDDIISQTHGNPLALKLAAAAALSRASVTFQASALQDVMQELTGLYLSEVSDPATRNALEKASVARRITRALLRALPDVEEDQFDQLRQLPFVDTWRDGLRLHDAVRDAIAGTLRATDPESYFTARRHAWAQMRDEIRIAPRSDLWRSTADMLFLIENPVVREAFFPSGDHELSIDQAHTADWMQIRDIVRRHDHEGGLAPLTAWWQHHREAFRVARNRDNQVVAFYCLHQNENLHPEVIAADSLTAVWQDHLADDAVPSGAKVLFLRRWLTCDEGEAPSAGQAACWLDAKRAYMELRPALRRVYLTVVDLPVYGPAATQLGFQHLDHIVATFGDLTFQTAMLDFGPESVDGWITRLVGDEMGIVADSLLDHSRRALVLDGQEISLTPLEFHLATYLESRAGTTATRDEIMAVVWGSDDGSTASNVVDAVVKTLRRKMGPHAVKLETVRGFGYRWCAD